MTTTPQKITFGEMRESGVHDVVIHCRDHRCSHHVGISADRWADDVRLSDIEPNFEEGAAQLQTEKPMSTPSRDWRTPNSVGRSSDVRL